jgi:hypothetical protein
VLSHLAFLITPLSAETAGSRRFSGLKDRHCAFDSSEYNVRKDSHCKAFPSIAGGSIDCDVDFWRRAGKRSRRTYWYDVQYWYAPPKRFTMAIARAQLVDVLLPAGILEHI